MSFDANGEPILSTPMEVTVPQGTLHGTLHGTVAGVTGKFQIQTPPFPEDQGPYAVGIGVIANDGMYHLSSYTIATPYVYVDVEPIATFIVAIGTVQRGLDVSFYDVSSTAAICDTEDGSKTFFKVVRTNDGRWKVTNAK